MSSDTPKERAPMKSFLVVRSQSHTSTDSLRSLSVFLSLLYSKLWLIKNNTFAYRVVFNTSALNIKYILLFFHLILCQFIICAILQPRVGQRLKMDQCTHKVNVSFHLGLRLERIVLVFCLVSFLGSGTILSFTYGSDRPLGSMGMRFLASVTENDDGYKQKIDTSVHPSVLCVSV